MKTLLLFLILHKKTRKFFSEVPMPVFAILNITDISATRLMSLVLSSYTAQYLDSLIFPYYLIDNSLWNQWNKLISNENVGNNDLTMMSTNLLDKLYQYCRLSRVNLSLLLNTLFNWYQLNIVFSMIFQSSPYVLAIITALTDLCLKVREKFATETIYLILWSWIQ